MISLGLCKECVFLSRVLNTPLNVELNYKALKYKVLLKTENGIIKVYYNDFLIWEESVLSDSSNFGIESIAGISHIIDLIKNGNNDYKRFIFIESERLKR
jgi:hypothetical protein